MKLAAKQAELAACPHVSAESAQQTVGGGATAGAAAGREIQRLRGQGGQRDRAVPPREDIRQPSPACSCGCATANRRGASRRKSAPADAYTVDYVGMDLTMDGIAVQADGGDFAAAVQAVREVSHRPLHPDRRGGRAEGRAGRILAAGEIPLLGWPTPKTGRRWRRWPRRPERRWLWPARSVDALVDLAQKVKEAGVDDIVLAPAQRSLQGTLRPTPSSAAWP